MIGIPKISSTVIMGELSSDINIDSVYDNFILSEEVVKVKCNNKEKTKTQELDCKTFYNQISFQLKNKSVIKFFNNGKFHVSGVKHLEEAKQNIQYILTEIKKIKGYEIVDTKIIYGLNTYKNKIITNYSEQGYMLKNHIKPNKIVIDGDECENWEVDNNLYIEKKHKERVKKIYNNMCEEVGYATIKITRKLKIIKLKGCNYIKKEQNLYDIIDKYKNNIGELEVNFTSLSLEKVILPEKVKILSDACKEDIKIVDIRIVNSNYNTKIGSVVNRDDICEYLQKNSIKYTYDPCSYPGVKFQIDKVKITIFRTGSVIFSTKEDVMTKAFPFIKEMFTKIQQKVKEKDCIVEEITEKLSIWDL